MITYRECDEYVALSKLIAEQNWLSVENVIDNCSVERNRRFSDGLIQSNRCIDTRDWRLSWRTNSCTINQASQIKYGWFSNGSATDETHDWAKKAEQTLAFLVKISSVSSYTEMHFWYEQACSDCRIAITSVEAERSFSCLKLHTHTLTNNHARREAIEYYSFVNAYREG